MENWRKVLSVGLVFIFSGIIIACDQNQGTLSTETIDAPSPVTFVEKNVEFGKYNYVKARLPVVHGIGSEAQTKIINDEYMKLYDKAVDEVKESYDEVKAKTIQDGMWYNYDFEVVAHTKDYVSIQMHVNINPGADHSISYTWIGNYNVKTGKKLKLGDFFGHIPDWRDKLEAELDARNKKRRDYYPDDFKLGSSMLEGRDDTFYIENGYLHVFYNPYEKDGADARKIELIVPISSLKEQHKKGKSTESRNEAGQVLANGETGEPPVIQEKIRREMSVLQWLNSKRESPFNLQEKNVALNNNFVVAFSKILGSPSVWDASSTITVDTLTRSPYSWLGKLCKITGEVYQIEEQHGQWSEILLWAHNKNNPLGVTTVSFTYNGPTNNIRPNEIYTFAGYFIGTYDSQNAMGGKVEGMVIVGNDIRAEKGHGLVPEQFAQKMEQERTYSLKDKTFTDLVEAWSQAHSLDNINQFNRLFDNTVLFYGSKLSKNECLLKKRSLLDKYPDFKQIIVSDIEVKKYELEQYLCSFIKRVTIGAKITDYPSYLIFRKYENDWKIVVESDEITDRNLAKKKGIKIPEHAIKGNLDVETNY